MSLLIPFIRQYVPGLRPAPGKALPKLKPIALVVLGGYLALIVAFLSRPVLLLGVAGGQILEQLPLSGLVVLRQFFFAWRNHDVMTQLAASLELAFWLFIPLGLGLFVWSLLRIFARLLLLIAHLVARRMRAQARAQTAVAGVVADRQPASAPAGPVAVPLAADRQPASAPARPVAVPLAPRPTTLRPLPTPLDGLGRPVAQPNNAALDEVRRRIEEVPLPAARELAEEVARTYERRLEQMSAELERAIAWANAVTEERNRLAVGVDEMQAALSTLAIDLRRMGKEMFTVADSASSAAASAQPGTEWTSQGQG
jgi:hypothetical protein